MNIDASEINPVLVIAEIGECFNGDLAVARQLIQVARDSGCDYAKFQTLDATKVSKDDPELDWFLRISLNEEQIDTLIGYGEQVGIPILFTPENKDTAVWLNEHGLNAVKIASSSLVDDSLLSYVNSRFQTVFLSTGMGSLDEIDCAVRYLGEVPQLYILHCISEYPTGPLLEKRGLKAVEPEDVHLNMMNMLMQMYPQYKVGYSDHTQGVLAPVAAVAAGAVVIEKHITMDREMPVLNLHEGRKYLGTDHILALGPDELKGMVRQFREVEVMLGSWTWERSAGENVLVNFLRQRFQS